MNDIAVLGAGLVEGVLARVYGPDAGKPRHTCARLWATDRREGMAWPTLVMISRARLDVRNFTHFQAS